MVDATTVVREVDGSPGRLVDGEGAGASVVVEGAGTGASGLVEGVGAGTGTGSLVDGEGVVGAGAVDVLVTVLSGCIVVGFSVEVMTSVGGAAVVVPLS